MSSPFQIPCIPANAGTQMRASTMAFWVYIVANKRNGTIYVGQTDHLQKRALEHREGLRPGFVKMYGCTRMVWAEAHSTRTDAFQRERRIKEWRRSWKLRLIEERNPTWRDLFEETWREDSHWIGLLGAVPPASRP